MARRIALLAVTVLLVTAVQARAGTPAMAAPDKPAAGASDKPAAAASDKPAAGAAVGAVGPVEEIIAPGCRFTRMTADVAVAADGVPRGFAAFSGGTCGDARVIRWFERGESDWTVVDTPWRGTVLAVAADATGTFLLYQAVDGSLWITRRLAGGATEGGRRISAVAAGGAVEGDVVASGGRWWALWSERTVAATPSRAPGRAAGHGRVGNPSAVFSLVQSRTIGADIAFERVSRPHAANDAAPTLALRPDGGVAMAWSRRTLDGRASELWVGTVEADGRRRSRRFELAPTGPGVTNDQPDVFVLGGRTYLAWRHDGRIVLADNPGGAYRARTFLTEGQAPSVRASFGRVFVAWTTDTNPTGAFVTERVGASWSGAFVSPPTPYEQALAAVVAAGGLAMVLMYSPTRLYARLQV
jgi:hypothetical protein